MPVSRRPTSATGAPPSHQCLTQWLHRPPTLSALTARSGPAPLHPPIPARTPHSDPPTNSRDAEQWARAAADNVVMARKLADIGREPPAGFHAPGGYKSVAGGQQARQQRGGAFEGMKGAGVGETGGLGKFVGGRPCGRQLRHRRWGPNCSVGSWAMG